MRSIIFIILVTQSFAYGQSPTLQRNYGSNLYGKKPKPSTKQVARTTTSTAPTLIIDAESLGGRKEDLLQIAIRMKKDSETLINSASYAREFKRFQEKCLNHSFTDEEKTAVKAVPVPSVEAFAQMGLEDQAVEERMAERSREIDRGLKQIADQKHKEAVLAEQRRQAEVKEEQTQAAIDAENRKAAAMESQAAAMRQQNYIISNW